MNFAVGCGDRGDAAVHWGPCRHRRICCRVSRIAMRIRPVTCGKIGLPALRNRDGIKLPIGSHVIDQPGVGAEQGFVGNWGSHIIKSSPRTPSGTVTKPGSTQGSPHALRDRGGRQITVIGPYCRPIGLYLGFPFGQAWHKAASSRFTLEWKCKKIRVNMCLQALGFTVCERMFTPKILRTACRPLQATL